VWPMAKKPVSFGRAVGGAALAALTLEVVAVSAARYLTGSETPPDVILANAHAHGFLLVHVASGIAALLVGPLQFVRTLRGRFPRVHRASGYIYILACAVAAPAGFVLALGTTAGPLAASGFAVAAVLWPAFTWLAWRAAVTRRFGAHREWMLRSYAILANAITLRLMLPAAGLAGIAFADCYPVIAWVSWMTNLGFCEWYIRRRKRGARAPAMVAEAA
jgi:uncharacterized membrane protein